MKHTTRQHHAAGHTGSTFPIAQHFLSQGMQLDKGGWGEGQCMTEQAGTLVSTHTQNAQ